ALVGGTASLSTSTLGVGSHSITITYSGAGDFHGSLGTASTRVIAPATLSGTVYLDANNNGHLDSGEQGIAGVAIRLTGTDDLGQTIDRSLATDSNGTYAFLTLRPGNYNLTETQPPGYAQGIDTVGTAGGTLVATDQFFVALADGTSGLNYNYGEQPDSTGPIQKG